MKEREREREREWSNPIQAGRKRQAAGNMGATEIVGRGWFFRMARRARKRMREAPQAKSNKSIQFKNPESRNIEIETWSTIARLTLDRQGGKLRKR